MSADELPARRTGRTGRVLIDGQERGDVTNFDFEVERADRPAPAPSLSGSFNVSSVSSEWGQQIRAWMDRQMAVQATTRFDETVQLQRFPTRRGGVVERWVLSGDVRRFRRRADALRAARSSIRVISITIKLPDPIDLVRGIGRVLPPIEPDGTDLVIDEYDELNGGKDEPC